MFHRILVEEWQRTLTMVSFAIFFVTFLATALRTWRMPRERLRHLESLPLGEDHGVASIPPLSESSRRSGADHGSAATRAHLLGGTLP